MKNKIFIAIDTKSLNKAKSSLIKTHKLPPYNTDCKRFSHVTGNMLYLTEVKRFGFTPTLTRLFQ